MDITSNGTLEIRNNTLLRTRLVQAADVDVNGLVTLDIEGVNPLCPILDIDDSLTINGLRIQDSGEEVLPTIWGDGMFLYLRHSGAGGSPLLSHQSGSVSASYRFAVSSGSSQKITDRLIPILYDQTASRWVVSTPFQQGDYTSSTVSNSSTVNGTNITDALQTLGSYLPLDSFEDPAFVVAGSPTYTTVLTVPCDPSTAYTAELKVACADGPLTAVRSGQWFFRASFHRNSTGGAVLDGTPNITTAGGFGSMAGQTLVSGNNVLFQIRFSGGATVAMRREPRITAQVPG